MLINYDPHSTSYRSAPSSRSTKTFFDTTSYRSAPSKSPCASSEAASSTYSTASTSCGASASPCPPPCPYPDEFEIETDLLVAVCATQTDSAISLPLSKDEIYMHWQDNAAHLQIIQENRDRCSEMLKRRRNEEEKEAKDIRRDQRKRKKRKQHKNESKFYDFMASVKATARTCVQAPMEDWGCGDDLDGWSRTIGTVSSTVPSSSRVGDDDESRSQLVKEEVPLPVEALPLLITRDERLCDIRHVPSKGLGVIATSDIAQGQAIVTEAPFLMVDHPPNIYQVNSRLAKLPSDLQTLFSTFNPSLSPHHTNRTVDIIATNVIPLGEEPLVDLEDEILPLDADLEVEQRCRSGLFKTICRVNHSCSPNSRWTWFDAGNMTLRALRPIANGEEITACYLQDTAMSHKDRQQALHYTWRFVCTCPVCSLPPDQQCTEDDRRGRFRDIREEYIGSANEDTWHREGLIACSAKIKKAIKLLEEGGQDGEIADCRWSLFLLSVRWGDEEKARKEGSAWLRQVLRMGDDPGDQYRGWVKRPRTAIDWGMWDDDRSGDESECGTDDDFERTYHALTRVRLQSANVSSMRTGSRSSRRAATMSGIKG